jgi:nucleotide-binding universal stress UspA family protein
MYNHILVPVDGSAASNRGVLEAIKLAKSTGARLRLVHVVDDMVGLVATTPTVYPVDVIKSLREAGQEILGKSVALVREHALNAESVLVESIGTPAARMIIAQARQWPADLIVIGTHGRRGVRRLVMGSDAEWLVRTAPVPILVVRAEPEAS